jgi:hypothetical protein
MKTKQPHTTQFHFRKFPLELFSAMREECKRRGIDQRAFVTAALKHYVEISKKKPPLVESI